MACFFTVPTPGATLTSATPANVLSQLLAPGSWLLWGQANFALAAATVTEQRLGISIVSATLPTQPGGGGLGPEGLTISPLIFTLLTNTFSLSCGPVSLVVAVPTTVYLVAQATFSVGSMTAFGTIYALPILGSGYNLIAS
jgi:hypothetical protein